MKPKMDLKVQVEYLDHLCPIMKDDMMKVYKRFRYYPEVGILSHSIDPSYNTTTVLQRDVNDFGVSGDMWHFVTGERVKISEIGQKHYLVDDGTESKDQLHS